MKTEPSLMNRRVKIVTTLGPATRDFENLEKLFLAGANVFRLNFSHGSHEDHAETYNNIKKLEAKYNKPIAVLADLQGPKLRVGKFKDGSAELKEGANFALDLNPELGDENRVQLPHPEIFASLKKGSELLVDDGKIKLVVESFTEDSATTVVVNGGTISNAKGVNFPKGVLKLSPLTEKDLKDLEFAVSLGVGYVCLSFVQLPSDVVYAKDLLNGRAKVISKIEKPSAVENIEEIIEKSDAIMVARGDLGVEMPPEVVPIVQKRIIRLCRSMGRPVIVATQMLDSMMENPVPTRAEASDVANAVYDGADAVMLSGETTVGKHPFASVSVMDHIITEVESDPHYWEKLDADYPELDYPLAVSEAVATSVGYLSSIVDAKYIVSFTTQGTTVNRVGRERTKAMSVALTSSKVVFGQLMLNWGVKPVLVHPIKTFSEVVDLAKTWLYKEGLVQEGDKIVVVAGSPVGVGGLTNTVRVIEC